jgi:hypothetical protein
MAMKGLGLGKGGGKRFNKEEAMYKEGEGGGGIGIVCMCVLCIFVQPYDPIKILYLLYFSHHTPNTHTSTSTLSHIHTFTPNHRPPSYSKRCNASTTWASPAYTACSLRWTPCGNPTRASPWPGWTGRCRRWWRVCVCVFMCVCVCVRCFSPFLGWG